MTKRITADHWRDIEISGQWIWDKFSLPKMACRQSGRIDISVDFMNRLSAVREEFGKPMFETSGYRSPEYNDAISSTGRTGPHVMGQAVDIAIYGESLYDLLPLLKRHGFTGIGLNQSGKFAGRFLHIDTIARGEGPRPTVWTY